MRSVSISDLRRSPRAYLDAVEHGETIEVANRGRAVARLVPVPGATRARLIEEGRMTPAKGDLLALTELPADER